jgi:hypothetical protein
MLASAASVLALFAVDQTYRPKGNGGLHHAESNEVFRVFRYSAEEIARAEATAGA